MRISETLIVIVASMTLAACGTDQSDPKAPIDDMPPTMQMPDEPDNMTPPSDTTPPADITPPSDTTPPSMEPTRPERPQLGLQIDRVGRAAINTALNNTFNGDEAAKGAAKDRYNAAGPTDWMTFQDDFAVSLAILDSLDTVCGNQLLADGVVDERYQALAGVLADDQLYVNIDSGECGTYLGLEAEVVGAVPTGAGGCGGRTPSDDVIERSYSVLAAGALQGIDDTIQGDDGEQSAGFPFLAPPSNVN